MNNEDREFIKEVRKKINYIEYVKNHEMKVKEYKREKMCRNLRICLFVSGFLCVILIPAIITRRFDSSFVFILGIILLSLSTCYENYAKEIHE